MLLSFLASLKERQRPSLFVRLSTGDLFYKDWLSKAISLFLKRDAYVLLRGIDGRDVPTGAINPADAAILNSHVFHFV